MNNNITGSMRMHWNRMALVTMMLAAACLLVGCKDNIPTSELDQFIAHAGQLEGQALMDTLHAVADSGTGQAVYANYVIGNKFYEAASDSASAKGWADGSVSALLDSAEIYFNRSVAQDSTFIEAMVNLGSVWDDRSEQLGSRQERDERIATAKKFYEMALAVDPADEKARCNLGSLYLRQRRTKEALSEFQTALEYDPKSSLAHYNLAIMFAEAKIYREAIAEWELAAKNDPDGDIGYRSRENIKIVKDLLNAPAPNLDH
jgi:tetratricopeptide (TPR) repeat protein